MLYLYIAAAAIILAALWIFLIATERPRGRLAPFEERYIAHRGLFGEGSPENSLSAFERAARAGYGIELDVQLTADSKLAVFHDAALDRMFGADGVVSKMTYEELSRHRFPGTDEGIPTLGEVLDLVGEDTPVIIEIKSYGNAEKVCLSVAEELSHRRGIYCVESFDPRALRTMKRIMPDVVRGQLSENFLKRRGGASFAARFVATGLLADFIGRPSFIAYNHRHRIPIAARILKSARAARFAAWTVRSEAELERAEEFYDIIIFDSFIPSRREDPNKEIGR